MKIRTRAFTLALCGALTVAAALPLEAKDKKDKGKVAKPLAGYAVLVVAPFTTDKSEATKDFPAGEEKLLKKNLLAQFRAKRTFDEVVEQEPSDAPTPAAAASPAADKRRLILTGTVIGYSKGSSTARFVMWPLPVAPSVVKVRFVFRDAESNEEVFQAHLQGKYNAIASLGVADKQESLAEAKGGVIRSLLKEINKRR